MEYGNQYNNTKSFYDWCIENDRMDLDNRFDKKLNLCTTKDVGFKSSAKCWFKCPRGLHDSEMHILSVVTNNPQTALKCKKCSSVAQIVIDNFGEDYLWKHWHPDNKISPWDVPAGNSRGNIMIKIQCDKKSYHVYDQVPASFAKGIGCPYCINRKVHPLDSFASVFPEMIDRWSNKNEKSPYEYSPHSAEKVWFTCPDNKHDDYLQQISNAVIYGFTCRKCENEKIGLAKRGENCRFWRGGTTEDGRLARGRFEYVNWRSSVFERDNYVCQCCGKRGGKLNAHHILSFAFYEELRYNIDNGITLCTKCHDSVESGSLHNIYGTRDVTPEQLREYILNKSNIDIYVTHPKILSLTQQNN